MKDDVVLCLVKPLGRIPKVPPKKYMQLCSQRLKTRHKENAYYPNFYFKYLIVREGWQRNKNVQGNVSFPFIAPEQSFDGWQNFIDIELLRFNKHTLRRKDICATLATNFQSSNS